ncbi:dTDP-4-dehydrorhamnose reductase [Planomonospora corallina]|uniref:dTDP-4-dehydrorhamnose reductase n=1 Tax=Planomonospora corallina TaxID=1806052 RepID=A0ABV8I6U6_9ACTN
MRWLVTGARGMLGTDLVALLRGRGEEVAALGRAELDVRDPSAVVQAVRLHRPDAVVNCAGWTAVNEAETREDEALALNGHAVRALAEACAGSGARLVQISTDYVFDGAARAPYPEDAPVSPVNAYGRTKLAGERAVLELLPETGYVVRTAWLYGSAGANFVRTIAGLERSRPTVEVVDDQIGQPTWTGDVAARVAETVLGEAPAGVYHATNSGRTSWYGLAKEIFLLLGADPRRVVPVSSDRYPSPARRPAFSVLGHDGWGRAGLPPLRDWRKALRDSDVLVSL